MERPWHLPFEAWPPMVITCNEEELWAAARAQGRAKWASRSGGGGGVNARVFERRSMERAVGHSTTSAAVDGEPRRHIAGMTLPDDTTHLNTELGLSSGLPGGLLVSEQVGKRGV